MTTTQRTIEFRGWASITDVPCPYACDGTIRWAEAGYVPGYRICDACGRHFELRENTLAANGRRDRITATDRAARALAEERHELEMAIYDALVAVREGCGLYLGTVSWDRHPYYRVDHLDTLAARVGGPNMPRGLAGLMDQMRRTTYPLAWAAWEALRAILPDDVSVHVYPDGQRANLIHKWTLGEYAVADLLTPESQALATAMAKRAQYGQYSSRA